MFKSSFSRIVRRLRSTRSGDGRHTLQDRALARRLFRTFERDLELANVHGIHFYVQNGIVTLYGTIRHELDRDLLVSFVRQIAGVKGVIENLQIVDDLFQKGQAELAE